VTFGSDRCWDGRSLEPWPAPARGTTGGGPPWPDPGRHPDACVRGGFRGYGADVCAGRRGVASAASLAEMAPGLDELVARFRLRTASPRSPSTWSQPPRRRPAKSSGTSGRPGLTRFVAGPLSPQAALPPSPHRVDGAIGGLMWSGGPARVSCRREFETRRSRSGPERPPLGQPCGDAIWRPCQLDVARNAKRHSPRRRGPGSLQWTRR